MAGLTQRAEEARGLTYNSRLEGRLDLLLLQEHPVDLLEKRVLLDSILAVLCSHTAQALVGVLGHELWDEDTEKNHPRVTDGKSARLWCQSPPKPTLVL